MSPAERSRIELLRLAGALRADIEALDRVVAQVRSLAPLQGAPPDDARLLGIAALVHHYYTGVEAAILRAVRTFEGREPSGPSWHQELLGESVRAVGERPALLSSTALPPLRRLLSFRHFFRHAYGVELEWRELRLRVDDLLAVHPIARGDLERLAATLQAAAETLGDEEQG